MNDPVGRLSNAYLAARASRQAARLAAGFVAIDQPAQPNNQNAPTQVTQPTPNAQT